jgi:spore coat protein U-like protein
MKLTKLFLALAAVSALVVVSDSGARAATTKTATFNVTASVIANCSISAADIDFKQYDPLATSAKTANGKVTIKCTKDAPITIGLSGGANLAAPYNQMKSPTTGSVLQYQLYQDAGYATQWNDSQPTGTGTVMSLTVGSLSSVDYTIYGTIPAGQPASVATDYADIVTASVNF